MELVNRLYPPAGQKHRFPVPIHLSFEDLDLAIRGKFVTRVIFLEDPQQAIPFGEIPGKQQAYEVPADEDPIEYADRIGRPMAIVRIGSKIPGDGPISRSFLFGSPHFLRYQPPPTPKSNLKPLQPVPARKQQPIKKMGYTNQLFPPGIEQSLKAQTLRIQPSLRNRYRR